jgi:small nuclear ribonucleoprotein (snRNP)-like protein
MTKKSKLSGSVGLVLATLMYIAILALPMEAEAKTTTVAVEGISYNVSASLTDNLKSLIGKKISVTLDSGKTFTGFVKAVGEHLVHLEKLDGKEYFDALLRIENISAIDTRFRDIERLN